MGYLYQPGVPFGLIDGISISTMDPIFIDRWGIYTTHIGPFLTTTLPNVPHVYYMCDTHVIHVLYFRYIAHAIHTSVIHV